MPLELGYFDTEFTDHYDQVWVGGRIIELMLRFQDITNIPESVGNLDGLESIYLGWNQLTSIPESIGNLSYLEKIRLTDNKLTTLPSTLCNNSSNSWYWVFVDNNCLPEEYKFDCIDWN